MTTDPRPEPTFENLRLVSARALASYLIQHQHLLSTCRWINLPEAGGGPVSLDEDQVVYHSWLPGFLVLPGRTAERVRELISGQSTAGSSEEHGRVAATLQGLGWCEDAEVDLDRLIERVQRDIFAWQNPRELKDFLRLVRRKRPRTVLEIGTFAGGVFYCLSQLADREATLISLDPYEGETQPADELFRSFGPPSQRFEPIRARSFQQASRRAVERILDGRELDLLFIDGDHSYGAVRSDFEMYTSFVAEDGLIVLHDICDYPTALGYGNDVALFWDQLTRDYETRAIIDEHPLLTPSPSRELLQSRWPALGIGVVLGPRPPARRTPPAPAPS